ncbi:MAG TPA: AI-2E family transporter, partial [Gemmataceae bacterium]|nr:AI-2E family transporter [Gemmataceae bacterium]
NAPATAGPVPVTIESPNGTWMSRVEELITPATEFLGQAAFAFILTVYMLLRKEDLRNRMIRLTGHGKVTTTTKAVDDASKRISRYLLTQLMLNSAFGVVIVVGLLLLGVEYALLWGFIAFVMRYVPYIGTWIGVIPPTLFAFAVYESLWVPVAVFMLFIGLEVLCNNIFEPMLYGQSMGLSEVAQLIAAGFWAFLWGPIGLILSGPLTVCLLVLGKYVARFQYLAVLLGDEPALPPRVAFYQRLTARDHDEAATIALAELEKDDATPEAVFDRVIVPALCLGKRDMADEDLSADDMRFAVRAAREIAEEVAGAKPVVVDGRDPAGDDDRVRLLLCPARDEVDHVGVDLLAHLLKPDRWEIEVAADEILASELLERIAEFRPAAVVIGALPPGGLAHTRYLVARVRAKFPKVKLIVGRWGRGEDFPDGAEQGVTGADGVDDTLAQTRKRLADNHSIFVAEPGKVEPVGTAGASHK